MNLKAIVDVILGRNSDNDREAVISQLYRKSFADLDGSREKLLLFQKDLHSLKNSIAKSH